MKSKIRKSAVLALILGFVGIAMRPSACEGRMYTAVPRHLARKILAEGLNPAKFRAAARFHRAAYLSRRPSTALAEKGQRSALLVMKESAFLKNRRNILDLRNPTRSKLRQLLGERRDLRGAYKQGVIGPKAGRMLGRIAGRRGQAIEYRSVKNGWTNLAIPKKLFERRPNIVSPVKILDGR